MTLNLLRTNALPRSVGVILLTLSLDPAKPLPGTPYIHMDAMAFGMGCCCLQITFQAWNVDEARRVYDALVPVAPIMVSVRPSPRANADHCLARPDRCEPGLPRIPRGRRC